MRSLKPLRLRGAPGTPRSMPRARSWAPAMGATTTCPTSTGPLPRARDAACGPAPVLRLSGLASRQVQAPAASAAAALDRRPRLREHAGAAGGSAAGPACPRCAAAMRGRLPCARVLDAAASCRPDVARRCCEWANALFGRPALRVAAAAERRARARRAAASLTWAGSCMATSQASRSTLATRPRASSAATL